MSGNRLGTKDKLRAINIRRDALGPGATTSLFVAEWSASIRLELLIAVNRDWPMMEFPTMEKQIMSSNRTEGTKKEVKGKVKEVAGKVTDNKSKEYAGKAEKNLGKAQKNVGKAADKARDKH